jgi:hypothetical protein
LSPVGGIYPDPSIDQTIELVVPLTDPPPPPETVPQLKFVPSVVKYFPLLPNCDGNVVPLMPVACMVKTPPTNVAVVPVAKFKVPAVPKFELKYCTVSAVAVDTRYDPI